MTTVISDARRIHATVADVWELLTDWDTASSWMGVEGLQLDGPLVRGARLTFRSRGKEHSSTIEQIDAPRLLVLRSTQGSVTADYTYRLGEIAPDLTEVSLLAELSVGGAMRLVSPMIAAAIRRADGRQLARFVELVDRSGGRAVD